MAHELRNVGRGIGATIQKQTPVASSSLCETESSLRADAKYHVHVANDAGDTDRGATLSSSDDPSLHCLKCGYILRGLDVKSQCPECGMSIETSAKLFVFPEDLARGFQLLGWSYASLFGWLFLIVDRPLFLVVAAAGPALRLVGLYYLTRAGLRAMPGISTNTTGFASLVLLEVVTVIAMVISGYLHGWHFDLHGELAALVWLSLAFTSASLVCAIAMARPLAIRLEHKLILLQLRTTQRCVIAAFGVSIAVGLVFGVLLGFWRFVLVGMFVHCVLGMLAAGHAMVSLAHVAHAVNEER